MGTLNLSNFDGKWKTNVVFVSGQLGVLGNYRQICYAKLFKNIEKYCNQ